LASSNTVGGEARTRSALGALRHLPDRLLHSLRRSRAMQRVRGRSPHSILFLCHGNVCRSPFAAAMFARLCADASPDRPAVRSAGFIGPGRAPPPEALAAAERVGIDLSAHRSALFTVYDVRAADLVVVMSPDQASGIRERFSDKAGDVLILGDLDPEPIQTRTIIDPWGQPDLVFDESYARIERCIGVLVDAMRQGRGSVEGRGSRVDQ